MGGVFGNRAAGAAFRGNKRSLRGNGPFSRNGHTKTCRPGIRLNVAAFPGAHARPCSASAKLDPRQGPGPRPGITADHGTGGKTSSRAKLGASGGPFQGQGGARTGSRCRRAFPAYPAATGNRFAAHSPDRSAKPVEVVHVQRAEINLHRLEQLIQDDPECSPFRGLRAVNLRPFRQSRKTIRRARCLITLPMAAVVSLYRGSAPRTRAVLKYNLNPATVPGL